MERAALEPEALLARAECAEVLRGLRGAAHEKRVGRRQHQTCQHTREERTKTSAPDVSAREVSDVGTGGQPPEMNEVDQNVNFRIVGEELLSRAADPKLTIWQKDTRDVNLKMVHSAVMLNARRDGVPVLIVHSHRKDPDTVGGV